MIPIQEGADADPVVTTVLDALNLRDLIELLDEVCRRRAVTPHEVCELAQTKAVASARHELWWRLRHHRLPRSSRTPKPPSASRRSAASSVDTTPPSSTASALTAAGSPTAR